MSYDMLSSYSPTHGVGVDVRVLDFKMHWSGFPLTSNFYIKIIKYPDEIIPKLYCSRKLFTHDMNPSWNERKIVRFKFDYIQTSYVKYHFYKQFNRGMILKIFRISVADLF